MQRCGFLNPTVAAAHAGHPAHPGHQGLSTLSSPKKCLFSIFKFSSTKTGSKGNKVVALYYVRKTLLLLCPSWAFISVRTA